MHTTSNQDILISEVKIKYYGKYVVNINGNNRSICINLAYLALWVHRPTILRFIVLNIDIGSHVVAVIVLIESHRHICKEVQCTPKKAYLNKIKKKEGKQFNKIKKIDQNYHNVFYKMGQKWWVFEGVPTHPNSFKVRTFLKLILHTPLESHTIWSNTYIT